MQSRPGSLPAVPLRDIYPQQQPPFWPRARRRASETAALACLALGLLLTAGWAGALSYGTFRAVRHLFG